MSRPPSRGFTLIELMVAVLVLGVLAALAYPSFLDALRRGRRAEAMTALAGVQQAQERWRSDHAGYGLDLAALGQAALTTSGYYGISLAAPAAADGTLATGYVLTAIGASGTSQAGDAACRRLSVRQLGGQLAYAGCGSCATFAYTPTHVCWSR
ncbi:MAG: type IV pilin protein [Rubrivivax sp.]